MAMSEEARQVWENWFNSRTITEGRDECGALIRKGAHDQGGRYGWEIDHIVPLRPEKGPRGADKLYNKRPLHWRNNDAKGNKRDGDWYCAKRN